MATNNPYFADVAGAFDAPMASFQGLLRNNQVLRQGEMEMAQMSAEAPLKMRELRGRAEKVERENAAAAELRRLYDGYSPDPEAPPSAQAFDMAQRVGGLDPNLAFRYLSTGSQMALREEQEGRMSAQAAAQRALALKRQHDYLYSIIGVVPNQKAYDARRMQLLSSSDLITNPEDRAFLENTPYEAYRALPQFVEAERKRAETAARQLNAQSYSRAAAAKTSEADTRAATESRRREEAERKAKLDGDKTPGKTGESDRMQAVVFLKATPEGKEMDGEVLRSVANDVAGRATALLASRRAPDIATARSMAFQELKATKALVKEEGWGGGWKYNPIEAFPATKLPSGAPAAAKTQPLPADLSGFRPDPNTIYTKGAAKYRFDAARGGLVKVQ